MNGPSHHHIPVAWQMMLLPCFCRTKASRGFLVLYHTALQEKESLLPSQQFWHNYLTYCDALPFPGGILVLCLYGGLHPRSWINTLLFNFPLPFIKRSQHPDTPTCFGPCLSICLGRSSSFSPSSGPICPWLGYVGTEF